METNNSGEDGNHQKKNKDNSKCGTNETTIELTMPRAQSNLDILSQTAAVIEEASLNNSRSDTASAITVVEVSSPQPVRVTPAEHQHSYRRILKTNEYGSFDDQSRKSFLALPEISSRTNVPSEYWNQYHHHQPSTFLEQKRGFLPPALSFESGGGILVGGQPLSMDGTSSYISPGIYLTHSYASNFSATSSAGVGTNHVHPVRVMSPPLEQVTSPQQQPIIATVSTESKNNTTGNGSSPACGGGDGDTVVNSFLSNPSNSFSSAGGASVSSSVIAALPSSHHPYQYNNGANTIHSAPIAAFVPPGQVRHPQRNDNNTTSNTQPKNSVEFSDEMLRENFLLRQQLAACNVTIATLQNQVDVLQNEVRQLRQLPSGKISQIPIDEMLSIMREYGSEVSDTAMPPRKSHVQKASVVRQFRRWNPNFTEWFVLVNGKWIPKLGSEGEKKRRQEIRLAYTEQRNKKQKLNASKTKQADSDMDDDDDDDQGEEGVNSKEMSPATLPLQHESSVLNDATTSSTDPSDSNVNAAGRFAAV